MFYFTKITFQCPDVLRDLVISVSLTLSFVSVILLVAAIVLFSIFDSIQVSNQLTPRFTKINRVFLFQCRRLSIHKNLATAFVFRFAVLAIWTIVQTTNVFQDCTRLTPLPLWDYVSFFKVKKKQL